MFKLQVVLAPPQLQLLLEPMKIPWPVINHENFRDSADTKMEAYDLVSSPRQSNYQSLLKSQIMRFHTIKFLHLTNPRTKLIEVYNEIILKFHKIYKDHQKDLQIIGLQDSSLCDLDPDFIVDEVFTNQDNMIVVLLKDDLNVEEYSTVWSSSMESKSHNTYNTLGVSSMDNKGTERAGTLCCHDNIGNDLDLRIMSRASSENNRSNGMMSPASDADYESNSSHEKIHYTSKQNAFPYSSRQSLSSTSPVTDLSTRPHIEITDGTPVKITDMSKERTNALDGYPMYSTQEQSGNGNDNPLDEPHYQELRDENNINPTARENRISMRASSLENKVRNISSSSYALRDDTDVTLKRIHHFSDDDEDDDEEHEASQLQQTRLHIKKVKSSSDRNNINDASFHSEKSNKINGVADANPRIGSKISKVDWELQNKNNTRKISKSSIQPIKKSQIKKKFSSFKKDIEQLTVATTHNDGNRLVGLSNTEAISRISDINRTQLSSELALSKTRKVIPDDTFKQNELRNSTLVSNLLPVPKVKLTRNRVETDLINGVPKISSQSHDSNSSGNSSQGSEEENGSKKNRKVSVKNLFRNTYPKSFVQKPNCKVSQKTTTVQNAAKTQKSGQVFLTPCYIDSDDSNSDKSEHKASDANSSLSLNIDESTVNMMNTRIPVYPVGD